MATSPRRIILVRHGRSAHTNYGWMDDQDFDRWRMAYEAAGIALGEAPPPALLARAAAASTVVASDAPRAIESARLLAPGREVLITPLLAELELQPPTLGRLRLPLAGWALAFGARSIVLRARKQERSSSADRARAQAAAKLLIELGRHDGAVLAVTHGSMRALLARELESAEWRICERSGRWRHWSAWTFSEDPGLSDADFGNKTR